MYKTLVSEESSSDYRQILHYSIGGRDWQFKFTATDTYVKERQGWRPLLIIIAGVLLVILVGALLLYGLTLLDKVSFIETIVKQRTEELTVVNNRLNQVFESAPNGLLMASQQGIIHFINTAILELFGYTRDELIGKPVEVLIPEARRTAHSQLRAAFLKKPTTCTLGEGRDLLAVRKDQSQFPVEVGLNPLKTIEGDYVLATVADITMRKKQEKEQLKLNQQLTKLNEALEKSNIELKQFAYIASHDLQTPLRGIAGFAQLLGKHYSETIDLQAKAYIQRIVVGSQRMQTLINDLLVYSRVEADHRPFQETCLNSLFDETMALLNPLIQETNTTVTRNDLPIVLCDRVQLAQLLENLIGNGIKYHADHPQKIHVAVNESIKHEWFFSIKDHGIGIAPRHHEQIFEVFRRLHTQNEYPGTGIGLAVCRRIVNRHGGRIWVESEQGTGSTFYFTLPRRKIRDDECNNHW